MNLRNAADQIRDSAIAAVEPNGATTKFLTTHLDIFNEFKSVDFVAVGKAAVPMITAFMESIKPKLGKGIIVTKRENFFNFASTGSIKVYEGGHPVPTDESVCAGNNVISFLKTSTADCVVFLFSGGGSAMLTVPCPGVTLTDLQLLTRNLLACGANIQEINTIRKHLDLVKGGGLLRYLPPQTKTFTLVLSDVIGDDLSVIASGPTYWDKSTIRDAENIIKKYSLTSFNLTETLKPRDKHFKHSQYYMIGNLKIAVDNAAREAKKLGFQVEIETYTQQGEAKKVGKQISQHIRKTNLKSPMCFIFAGETTVTLDNHTDGMGGRNQELILAAGLAYPNQKNVLYYSFGTDGIDGPTDAAGAFWNQSIYQQALDLHLDQHAFLDTHNSYNFFEKTGGLIKTGPTGTNVGDITLVLFDRSGVFTQET